MKMNIGEFAELTGVSVRTLRYYDETGLLRPAFVDEQNGYRCYDEKSLERMQEILFYRELDFPLKTIERILSSPDRNKTEALAAQRELLVLKKQRLDRLITAIDEITKGNDIMDMKAFDNSEFLAARDKYMKEAEERWGGTAAYEEFKEKTAAYSEEDHIRSAAAMGDIFAGFNGLAKKGLSSSHGDVLKQVEKLKEHISENYYTCTDEILSGLGQMYVNDDRFKKNIDRAGEGTAEFVSAAINAYCGKNDL